MFLVTVDLENREGGSLIKVDAHKVRTVLSLVGSLSHLFIRRPYDSGADRCCRSTMQPEVGVFVDNAAYASRS